MLKPCGKVVTVDFVEGGDADRLWGESYYTPRDVQSMLKDSGFKEAKTSFVYKDVVLVSAIKI